MYHPGIAEARHPPCPDKDGWYQSSGASPKFIRRMVRGEYTPCGTSGNQAFMHRYDNENQRRLPSVKGAIEYGCCFVHGREYMSKRLWRRWSCCKHLEIVGTLKDLYKLPGCCVYGSKK